MTMSSKLCRRCLVVCIVVEDNREFHAYLLVLNHCVFDMILGINWCSVSHAVTDYYKKAIVFQF